MDEGDNRNLQRGKRGKELQEAQSAASACALTVSKIDVDKLGPRGSEGVGRVELDNRKGGR